MAEVLMPRALINPVGVMNQYSKTFLDLVLNLTYINFVFVEFYSEVFCLEEFFELSIWIYRLISLDMFNDF